MKINIGSQNNESRLLKVRCVSLCVYQATCNVHQKEEVVLDVLMSTSTEMIKCKKILLSFKKDYSTFLKIKGNKSGFWLLWRSIFEI